MDENNDNKKNVVYEVKPENNTNFKTVQNPGSYKNYDNNKKQKSGTSFTKSILLPFFSGVVGCAVVVGTCFGVPSIRSNILGTGGLSTTSSNTSNTSGYVSQTSLSNY